MKNFFTFAICIMAVLFAGCEPNSDISTGTGSEIGHEYVDLGLSVKWATCNVGASKPEEYGDYFAWGETEPKSTYNWSTYKWCNGSDDILTKYCTNSRYGTLKALKNSHLHRGESFVLYCFFREKRFGNELPRTRERRGKDG